ncbi:MAG: AMP-binding protein, partial [Micromonosporaceae bacterium]
MNKSAVCTGPPLDISADFPRDLAHALTSAAERSPGVGITLARSDVASLGRGFLSYPALLERARRILGGLRAHGVAEGDHVIVHCSDLTDFLCGFWACALGRIRPLLLARPSAPDAVAATTERLRQAAALLGEPVVLASSADIPEWGAAAGARLLDVADCAGHLPANPVEAGSDSDVALLLMSSGSTGVPKLVQLTHGGLREFAAGTQAMLPLNPGDTTLNWLPLDHSGAFLLYHLHPVFAGCGNIHVPASYVLADPLRWLDLIAEHRVNHTWAPNFGYQLVNTALREQPDRSWDLSHLRSLVSGGEQITFEVMTEFLDKLTAYGVGPGVFRPAWGMTETCTGIAFARFDDPDCVHHLRAGSLDGDLEWLPTPAEGGADQVTLISIGSPAPGAVLRVVDERCQVLPEARIGRLQVKSARITPGYFGNPEADRDAFPEGDWPSRTWLDTGDLAFVKNGQVVITGRGSDRIIVNGQNHHTYEIESIVHTVPGVAPGMAAAVAAPDPATGTDRLAVFFVPDSDHPAQTASLVRQQLHTRRGLAAQVIPISAADFPKTPSGKVQRAKLRQRLVSGEVP